MDEARLTVVASGLEAEMICGRLRLERIRCYYHVTDNAVGGLSGALLDGPTEVIVDAAKLEQARELLAVDGA